MHRADTRRISAERLGEDVMESASLRAVAASLLALLGATRAVASPIITATGFHRPLEVSRAYDGSFVVVGPRDDGFDDGPLIARRFDASGQPIGAAVDVSNSAIVTAARVAQAPSGAFVVAWSETDCCYVNPHVEARRFAASGAALGAPFRVDPIGSGEQASDPSVAIDVHGNFVVAWREFEPVAGQATDNLQLFAQRYDSAGTVVGGPIAVTAPSKSARTGPAIAAGPWFGTAAMAWVDAPALGILKTARLDGGGSVLARTTRIPGGTADASDAPAIAVDGAGNFVVAWIDAALVRAQRFHANGNPNGAPIVAGKASYPVGGARVAMDHRGDFVIAWFDGQQCFSGLSFPAEVDFHRYDSAGKSLGQGVGGSRPCAWPGQSIAMDYAGNFAVSFENTVHLFAGP